MKADRGVLYAIGIPFVLIAASSLPRSVVRLSYQDASPVLEELSDAVPAGLKGEGGAGLADQWLRWLGDYESETARRLERGDEDSLVNFVIFGTSFTRQPRLSAENLRSGTDQSPSGRNAEPKAQQILRRRIEDFVQALSSPGDNERLRFLRSVLASKGIGVDTSAGRAEATKFVVENLFRVLRESEQYSAALKAAGSARNATEEFAERSTLFRSRGISLDTSLLPDFAVEETLKSMIDRGLLAPGKVLRAAVIGPGLDFTDKNEGYDFFPVQTIQPFALIDSLVRLGLARPESLEITAIDVSPRVIAHITRARQRAARGTGYTLNLLRDPRVPWMVEFTRYWRNVGDRIGSSAPAGALPAGMAGLEARSIRVRPGIVSRIRPELLNIVTSRLDLPDPERFDLIVATNVFVYYGVFEQCLALVNVERMLRPGGFLISNNALLELPSTRMRAVDYQTVVYSDRPSDGDRLLYFRREQDH